MNFNLTITYRLAGNLFANNYYVSADNVGMASSEAQHILSGMAMIQTADVEYVSMGLTQLEAPYATTPLTPDALNGAAVEGHTAPAITFLEFVFRENGHRAKVTHRIRGFAANDITDLGVFNADTLGVGDYDGSSGAGSDVPAYRSYITTIESHTKSPSFYDLTGSSRVSVGAKRATRRL